MNHSSFSVNGQIVDLKSSEIFSGIVHVTNGRIVKIERKDVPEKQYIMPGLIDSHVHIESSMLTPSEFARLAVVHGTVAVVSDPHEIANVLGIDGVKFMIENGKKTPFKFYFGCPSCVPATPFETSGTILDAESVEKLMALDEISHLGEMMNFPGVLAENPSVLKKIEIAKKYNKPIDGHAPNVRGKDIEKYTHFGISTDHECCDIDEAKEKIVCGMKILIREGSAARNFDALIPLMQTKPDQLLFCTDDKHPDELVKGHIDVLVMRAIALGYSIFDVLRSASLNTVEHYKLDVGLLQEGCAADMIIVDNLQDFNVLKTYIDGILVAENGKSLIASIPSEAPNHFINEKFSASDFFVADEQKPIRIIEVIDGQLFTKALVDIPKVENGNMVSDLERDLLKIAVINRYEKAKPAIGFIKNIGLKKGAFASSIAHDSHNIIVVGTNDNDLAAAVNLLIDARGGVAFYSKTENRVLSLPVAGLMSNCDGYVVANEYEKIDRIVKENGSTLQAPFMTLAFMALLVIPELKLSDKGLFDGTTFNFVPLCV
ncbi:MAG: adenine deaminase [Lentimicrobiaceae bacterium]|nr:adenine deaminase [Lentimicrobiaceae bacterium]